MSSDILVRDQIFSTYDSLYDAEKKVADYLISHPSGRESWNGTSGRGIE